MSSPALRKARFAYERTHVLSALRGLVIAAALTALAIGLHPIRDATWLVAAALAATLATLSWRGGPWRRGALAGVIAGLPPLIAPTIVFALGHGGHCADCEMGPTLPCILTCFATSSVVGVIVGYHVQQRSAIAAIATGALTGLLACGTTGLGGAAGIVIGLVAGGVTGWVFAERAARGAAA